MELIKFMALAARVPADRLPDAVVFYDGYNDANHGFFMHAVWQSVGNQWIGAASEIEGGSSGGTGGGATPVAPPAPMLLP